MVVYIELPRTGRTMATVTAVRASGVDAQLADGSLVIDARVPVYDEAGNALSLSEVQAALAAGDIDSQYAQAGRILMGESV